MMELPTEPDGFPDELELTTRDCRDCGAEGYVPAHQHERDHPRQCAACVRADFRQYLDPEMGIAIDRTDALDRIQSRGLLPIQDPADEGVIIAVDVDRVAGEGQFVKTIKKIVAEDCPECPHDRATYEKWRVWTCESGHTITCRACGHTIEEHSSL